MTGASVQTNLQCRSTSHTFCPGW